MPRVKKLPPESASSPPPARRVNKPSSRREGVTAIMDNLKTTNVPDASSFRGAEKSKIVNFIADNLRGESKEGSTMIVFGQPGLGKSLIMLEIMRDLQGKDPNKVLLEPKSESEVSSLTSNSRKSKSAAPARTRPSTPCKFSSIECFYFNAMTFSRSTNFILEVYSKIVGSSAAPGESIMFTLEKLIKEIKRRSSRSATILLIDELETLKNCDSDFHLVFDLLSLTTPGFVKIGISNTMDLFTSDHGRMQFLSYYFLTFVPYNEQQLVGILKDRIFAASPLGRELWPEKCIEFLVRKTITNKASDVRFVLASALEITEKHLEAKPEEEELDRPAEPSSERPLEPVTIREVMEYIERKLRPNVSVIIERLSFLAKVLLLSLWDLMNVNSENVPLDQVQKKFLDTLIVLKLDMNDPITDLIDLLKTCGLVSVEKKQTSKKKQVFVRCNLSKEHLREQLQKIELFARFFAAKAEN